jgi:hypothetical protein
MRTSRRTSYCRDTGVCWKSWDHTLEATFAGIADLLGESTDKADTRSVITVDRLAIRTVILDEIVAFIIH